MSAVCIIIASLSLNLVIVGRPFCSSLSIGDISSMFTPLNRSSVLLSDSSVIHSYPLTPRSISLIVPSLVCTRNLPCSVCLIVSPQNLGHDMYLSIFLTFLNVLILSHASSKVTLRVSSLLPARWSSRLNPSSRRKKILLPISIFLTPIACSIM